MKSSLVRESVPPPEADDPSVPSALPVAAHWGLVPSWLAGLVGDDPARRAYAKSGIVRGLILANVLLGTRYVAWRATESVNWELWPLGLALLAAELFSYTDSLLFGMNMWRVRSREAAPPPLPDRTVDVFVTTYDEPVELVRRTAIAARDIRYPHRTWVLDDGDRPEMRRACDEEGVGYLTRHAAWNGKKRHAKAGNLINALYQTSGEFVLVLDADQVPRPDILDRTLGWFRDPGVAFVQTPQWFRNIPSGDPFGSDSPLFYGPIQAGKDGWNSAFFCGSNAVLRREALMHVGVVWYARDLDRRVRSALRAAVPLLRHARRRLGPTADPRGLQALDGMTALVREARRELRVGRPLQAVTWRFQRGMARLRGELTVDPPEVRDLVIEVDMDLAEEAEPVLPLATMSVTEDMATAMRLHSLGWRSIYHHEILAAGLAPEDLRSALQQRLRWAQGTLQVMLRENPLWQPGLTFPQRLLYFGTMWTYLSGFAAIVYLFAPVLYLLFGLTPVVAYSGEFFGYLLPWLVVNQLLFVLIGWGLPTWRGQQYSLALFPLWLKAVVTTGANVWFGRPLGFVVTPKTRREGLHLRLVWPQLAVMGLLVLSVLVALGRLALGWSDDVGPVFVNVLWASYDLAMLSVVLVAATYRHAQ